MTEEDGGKTRVRVHQLVKSLQGNVLSDSQVFHVFTMSGGLIAAMDLGDEADPTAGPSVAFRTKQPWHWKRKGATGSLFDLCVHNPFRRFPENQARTNCKRDFSPLKSADISASPHASSIPHSAQARY
jgi:hypothetical protein